jgi:hypothetical protein
VKVLLAVAMVKMMAGLALGRGKLEDSEVSRRLYSMRSFYKR